MRAAVVVDADPVTDDTGCVLDALEAMPVSALLFQRPDHAPDHAILLRAVWGDELLLQAIAADQCRELAAGEE